MKTYWNTKKKNAGFTLAELLTVVAIIGVLVAISIPSFSALRANSERQTCDSNMKSLGTLLTSAYTKAYTAPVNYDNLKTIINEEFEAHKNEYACPHGGEIKLEITGEGSEFTYEVYCDYHKNGVESGSDPKKNQDNFVSAGEALAKAFTEVVTNSNNTSEFNSNAQYSAGSAVTTFLNYLTDEQREILSGYVWTIKWWSGVNTATGQKVTAPRLFFTPITEVQKYQNHEIDSFIVYKLDPVNGVFQLAQGGKTKDRNQTDASKIQISIPNVFGQWTDDPGLFN